MGDNTIIIGVVPTGNTGGLLLKDTMHGIGEVFNNVFNAYRPVSKVSCRMIPPRPIAIPGISYDEKIGKYSVEPFFTLGGEMKTKAEKKLSEQGKEIYKVIVITDVPLFSYVHNSSVFGEADIGGDIAVVSIAPLGVNTRLHNFKERVIKECVHELGHTIGLGHCMDKTCVMCRSVDVYDVDNKSKNFCDECMQKLEQATLKVYRMWDGR